MRKNILFFLTFLFTLVFYGQELKPVQKTVDAIATDLDFDFTALQKVSNTSVSNHTYIFKKEGIAYYYTGDEKDVQALYLNSIESTTSPVNLGCPKQLPKNCVCSNGYVIEKK